MNYNLKTNIKILKKLWFTLKEMGLQGLLTGDNLKFNIVDTIDFILEKGKLNEVCQTITQTNYDFEELELKEVVEILTAFFTACSIAITTSLEKS
jgi:hypothetical protein